MSKETSTPSFEQTKQFFREAAAEGAHKIIHPTRSVSTEEGLTDINNMNLAAIYVFTKGSYREIGGKYRISRQRVAQKVQAGIEILLDNSTDALKSKYPLDNITTRKPADKNSKIETILRTIDAGLEQDLPIEKIVKEQGYTGSDLYRYRDHKRRAGKEIDKSYFTGQVRKFEMSLGGCNTPEEVQRLFDSITPSLGHNILIGRRNILVVSLQKTLREFKLPFSNKRNIAEAATILKDLGIPVCTFVSKQDVRRKYELRYYFVDKRDVEKIKSALKVQT